MINSLIVFLEGIYIYFEREKLRLMGLSHYMNNMFSDFPWCLLMAASFMLSMSFLILLGINMSLNYKYIFTDSLTLGSLYLVAWQYSYLEIFWESYFLV